MSPKDSYAMLTTAEIENGNLRAEIERLTNTDRINLKIIQDQQAEIERLTAVLQEALADSKLAWDKVRRALEPKP